MVPVFKNGECVYTSPSVMDIRKYCMEEQNTLWDETRRLVNPHEVYVDLSDRLYRMKTDLLNQMHPGDLKVNTAKDEKSAAYVMKILMN